MATKKITINTKKDLSNNPIIKMIEDKRRIIEAVENGVSVSSLKGIKIVAPI